MIVFDQEKLSAFFETVSSGFERSPLEIILVILSFLTFVILLIIIYRLQRRRVRQQQRRLADGRYRQIVEKLVLTPSEEDLVQRMARYLKEPEKKYLILINQPTFNFCAVKLRKKDATSTTDIAELRSRLGFRLQGPEQIPASSAELPEGQGLLLVATEERSVRKAQGRVQKQGPRSFVVQLLEAASPFREGEAIRIYFQNRAGLFSFDSTIQSVHNGAVQLQHGEDIRRIQRRKYYRRRISQPVAVRYPGAEEQPVLSTFYDLGGNGASLKNPGKRYTPGDALELTFLAAGERFSLIAEVLRTSKNGEVLHVRFAPMRETTRDRIIGSLFKGAVPPRVGS
ncbi:MAG: PilZ domain-containing protein [Spirochaetaceae bacterium]|nr:MAG: PilZ domain-containing protein [Spirochaetaceae bacterium]